MKIIERLDSMSKKILVVVGSVRVNRLAQRFVDGLVDVYPEADIADFLVTPLPFYNEAVHPKQVADGEAEFLNPVLTEWSERVKAADFVILLSPEYNKGVTAVLKNAIDSSYEWRGKDTLVITYAWDGGTNVQQCLNAILANVEANVVAMQGFGIGDLPEAGNIDMQFVKQYIKEEV